LTCPSLQECRGEGKEFVINVAGGPGVKFLQLGAVRAFFFFRAPVFFFFLAPRRGAPKKKKMKNKKKIKNNL
jgi:hypothetical protein